MRIATWNVNGIRAAARNGFTDWLETTRPDIVCLQETRATEEDVPPEVRAAKGYTGLWTPAVRKGYSGVATLFRKRREPRSVQALGVAEFDAEGRVQVLEYPDFTLINAYYPNSQPERARLAYKLAFCDAMLALCERLRAAGRHVVVCGDYNIAHREIDLARPKDNEHSAGYYVEERRAMTEYLHAGYVDTFRHFCREPGHYTWWSYRAGARGKNIGWRIDYHCVNREFVDRLKGVAIQGHVLGSDHCPVVLTLR